MPAMAVKLTEESLHQATVDLILQKPRKFYCAPMRAGHWQLRSLISSPRPNIIYYPNGKDVHVIDTDTHKRYLLTTLPFEPRCLTASKDWLCCGGDKGDYVAVCLIDRAPSEGHLLQDAEPNIRLPLNLDPFQRSSSSRRLDGMIQLLTRSVGADIVNCITIWSPRGASSKRIYKEPVAIVSNNDHTVSILKLESSELLEKLTLPDCVNRTVMSPDGELLISICDDPFLYIHKRKSKSSITKDRFESGGDYCWFLEGKIQLEGKVHLEGQRGTDLSAAKGSFAAAFSPSGKYLAVATQYGIISVFDAEQIFAPPVMIFTSSRPYSGLPGYVRAMEFCPGPFDLLAWTEAQGRVGIADVRKLFLSRQLLILDSSLHEVERVSTVDVSTPEQLVDSIVNPRRRQESPSRRTPDYLGLNSGPDERRQLRLVPTRGLGMPYSAAGLEILEAHRVARQNRDISIAREDASRGASSSDAQRPLSSSYWAGPIRAGRISTAGLPASLREFISQDRAPSFRSFINERNREHDRRNQVEREPRSRTSLLLQLAEAEQIVQREILDSGTSRTDNRHPPSRERIRLSMARRQEDPPRREDDPSQRQDDPSRRQDDESQRQEDLSQRQDDPNNLWTAWDSYQSRYLVDTALNRSSRLGAEAEDDDSGHFANRLRQPWRGLDELNEIALGAQEVIGASRSRTQNVLPETMGCCWSHDGRVLYVGADDGIHEFHVNINGRKKFPSLVFC